MKPPPPISAVHEGRWRRDVAWSLRCYCGHDRSTHRYDGDRTRHPCTVGACGCNDMRPHAVVWRDHREVIGLIEGEA